MRSKRPLLTFIYCAHTLLFVFLLPGLSSFAIAASRSRASTHRNHMAVSGLDHHRVRRTVGDITGPHLQIDSNLDSRQSGNSSASLEAIRVYRIKNIILGLEAGDKNISTWYMAVHD